MKASAGNICNGILAVLAIAFAIKVFLYGGSEFQDPNDSPLYQSTLARAVDNFKESDYVVSRDGAPGSRLPGAAALAAGAGQGQEHAGHGHQPQGQGEAGLGQAAQAPADHGCKDVKAGLEFIQQGDFKKAVASFEVAAQQCLPDDPCVQTYLGMAYDRTGDKEKSRQAYQRADQLKKAQPSAGVQGQP